MTTHKLSYWAATGAILAIATIATWGLPQAFSQFQSDAAPDSDPFSAPATIAAAETAEDGAFADPAADIAPGDAGTLQWDVTLTSEDSDYDAIPRSQKELAIRTKLEEPVELQYADMPLAAVAEDLSRRLQIHIEIDVSALQDLGIDVTTLVSANYRDVSLRSALDLLLDGFELTYVVEREYLLITSTDEAEQRLDTRVYPIRPQWNASAEELIQAIATIASPISWDINGGPGSIVELGNNVIVHQTEEVHAEVKDLLRQIDTAARLENGQ